MNYSVNRKPNRKTASINVFPDNSVSITVPDSLSEDEIEKVIKKKKPWILKKKALNNEVRKPAKDKEYVSGEAFSYLGRNYRLKVNYEGFTPVAYVDARLMVGVKQEASIDIQNKHIKESLIAWYKSHALPKFKQRSKKYEALLGVSPKVVKLGNLKSQWGSCHQDKTIVFNWKVIMAPMGIVDYVVAHELCHLVYHDHSKDFWNLLGRVIPDYAERKDWLRINGSLLEV